MKNYNNFDAIAKEHKKLYKSGKTWMAATLMTVGLAGGVMLAGTTTASADEVKPVQSVGTIQASQQVTDPELANAQSDAQKQQSTIDNANAQLKDQQNQLSEAQGQQSSAQQELDQAKQAQQTAIQNDSNVQTAIVAINNAQQKVSTAQTSVIQTTKELSEAKNRQKQASDELNYAKNGTTQQIGFQLPDGYTRENYYKFQDALADGDTEGKDAWNNLASQNYMKFKYVHNAHDKQESVDLAHLTNQQRIEISQFAADLLNPLREKIGAQPFVVSQGSVDLAQAVADQYNVDKVYIGHDVQGMREVEINNARAFREAVEGLDSDIDNMDDLKSAIFSSIDDMIFNDAQVWGHARTLLGLLNDTDLVNDKDPVVQSYLGISVSGDAANGMMLHFIPTYDDVDELIGNPVHPFDKTIIQENRQANTADIKTAQAKLNQANTEVKNSQQAKESADEQLNQAQVELATANHSLEVAKTNANANANQAVKDAQKKLDTINGKITDLQNAIATTKATISNAQAQLDKDNQKIADIKNDSHTTRSDTGKDEGNKGTTIPTNPSKDANKGSEPTNPTNPAKTDDGKKGDNQGTTMPSEPSKGDDQKDHQTTPVEPSKPSDGNKDNVTPTDPSNNDSKDSETTNPTTLTQLTTPAQPDTGNAGISGQAGHKPAPSNKGSEVSDNTDTKPTIVFPTTGKENGSAVSGAQGQNTIMTREQYKAQQAKLPQTGNNDSKAVIALGVLASMFGFGLITEGKKEF